MGYWGIFIFKMREFLSPNSPHQTRWNCTPNFQSVILNRKTSPTQQQNWYPSRQTGLLLHPIHTKKTPHETPYNNVELSDWLCPRHTCATPIRKNKPRLFKLSVLKSLSFKVTYIRKPTRGGALQIARQGKEESPLVCKAW